MQKTQKQIWYEWSKTRIPLQDQIRGAMSEVHLQTITVFCKKSEEALNTFLKKL